jgi:hypothetical protein
MPRRRLIEGMSDPNHPDHVAERTYRMNRRLEAELTRKLRTKQCSNCRYRTSHGSCFQPGNLYFGRRVFDNHHCSSFEWKHDAKA